MIFFSAGGETAMKNGIKCLLALCCAAMLIFCLASCSGGSGDGTIWPAMEKLKALDESKITSISYKRATEGGINEGTSTDAETIEELYLRLCNVSISGKSDMSVQDNDLSLTVEAGDTNLKFNFEGDILILEDGSRYETEKADKLRSYVDGLVVAEQPPKPEPVPDDDKEYNISDGMQTTASDDGSIEYIYFNDFMITMPNNDKWSYDMTDDSVTFYLFSAQQEGYGGKLVTIKAYDMDDNSYEELPSYHVAGIGKNVNKRFIAIYPTDVQWNHEDSTQDADYRDLQTYLQKIGDNAVNSPVQTADSD